MLRRIAILMLAGVLCMFVDGCKKASDDQGTVETTTEQVEETGMKTADELKQEAEQTITEENVEEELDKVEQEIEADTPQ